LYASPENSLNFIQAFSGAAPESVDVLSSFTIKPFQPHTDISSGNLTCQSLQYYACQGYLK